MSPRSKFLALLLCGTVAAGGAAAAFFLRAAAAPAALATGEMLTPPRRLDDFSLIDHHGARFAPRNLRGHWSLMFFGYTHCPDFCPTTLATLAAVQKRLRAAHAAQPQVIFVSVDVQRDTPAQLARYVPYFDADFLGVTAADQSTIEALARRWGVAVLIQPGKDGNYTVDHSGAIFVLDQRGDLAAVLTGPFTVDALTADIERLAAAHA